MEEVRPAFRRCLDEDDEEPPAMNSAHFAAFSVAVDVDPYRVEICRRMRGKFHKFPKGIPLATGY